MTETITEERQSNSEDTASTVESKNKFHLQKASQPSLAQQWSVLSAIYFLNTPG